MAEAGFENPVLQGQIDPDSGTDSSIYFRENTYNPDLRPIEAGNGMAPAPMPDFIPPPNNRRPGDEGLTVEFYWGAPQNCDLIRIHTPGDPHTIAIFEADDHYQQRFPEQWAKYRARVDQFADQVRLEEVAWLDDGTRMKYKPLGIFTLEHIAAVPDGNLRYLGPNGQGIRARAVQEVADRRKVGDFNRVAGENAALQRRLDEAGTVSAGLREEVTAAQKANADLLARVERLEKAPKK